MAALGKAQACSLRACSREFAASCDDMKIASRLSIDDLAEVLPYLRRLPNLMNVKLCSSPYRMASFVEDGALDGLSGLTSLALNNPLLDDDRAGADGSPRMTITNLGALLLPWNLCLKSLSLEDCYLSECEGKTLGSPGFLSRFPQLQTLCLFHTSATPHLSTLDLTGCTALESLTCFNCNVNAMDVSACAALKVLDCCWNKLSMLDLSGCPVLKSIYCSSNPLLDSVSLSAHGRLQKLLCAFCKAGMVISGGARIEFLSCDASAFCSVAAGLRAHLHKLNLEGSFTGELAGFVELRILICKVDDTSSINLQGCSAVDVTVYNMSSRVRFHGRDHVQALCVRALHPIDLTGFTALQKLTYDFAQLHNVANNLKLNLSACISLRIVTLEYAYANESQGILSIIGCPSLEELNCDSFCTLTELHLSACGALRRLSCFGCGLVHLDVSGCPLLVLLDVRSSPALRTLCTDSCVGLVDVLDDDCPLLQRGK